MTRSAALSLPLLAALALAGCAAEEGFPSLAPRAVEKVDYEVDPVRSPLAVAHDPALAARASALLGQARSGDRDFQSALGAARSTAARAGAARSESWIAAQEALSRLEAAQKASAAAAADLDALAVSRSNLPTNARDFEALVAAQKQAAALSSRQKAESDRIRASLRSP
jgi:hypothetical protein